MAGRYRPQCDESKFLGSFSLHSIPCENRLLSADVRLSSDGTFYTVILNGSFFAHMSKDAEGWKDSAGLRSELISIVGKKIDEHFAGE
jgi:hypothetical protein